MDVDEKTLYTGFENVPDYRNGTGTDYVKFWAIDSTDDGVLDAVFIYGGVASNSNKTYFYVKDAGDFETYDKNKTSTPRVSTALRPPTATASSPP